MPKDNLIVIKHPFLFYANYQYHHDNVHVSPNLVNITEKPYLLVRRLWIPCQDFESVEDIGAAKRGMTFDDKIVFDLETMFFRLLMVGQKRQL